MKILLVDDEPRVLEGLERLLFEAAPEDWNVTCEVDAGRALERLEKGNFDIVVTDIRMPIMDGAALLEQVRERWPNVVRFVLSGHSDEESSLRVAHVAHQFLTKPCSAEQLVEALQRIMVLRSVLLDEKMFMLVGSVDNLPTPPRVYQELSRALSDPDVGPEQVARVVRKDPAISAKLLQLVNSSFFFRGASVTDVSQAVARLGLRIVRSVALSIALYGRDKLPARFQLDRLQAQSVAASVLAEHIATEPRQRDTCVTAALLCNIGVFALAIAAPQRLDESMQKARESHTPLHLAEHVLYGVTHAELGAYLLGLWGLPHPVVEAVAHHHNPARALQSSFGPIAITHVASTLAEDGEVDLGLLQKLHKEAELPGWQEIASRFKELA